MEIMDLIGGDPGPVTTASHARVKIACCARRAAQYPPALQQYSVVGLHQVSRFLSVPVLGKQLQHPSSFEL